MMLVLHLALPFLIGNVFCSEYVGTHEDIGNSRDNFIVGEDKPELVKTWNRGDNTVVPSANENSARLRKYFK